MVEPVSVLEKLASVTHKPISVNENQKLSVTNKTTQGAGERAQLVQPGWLAKKKKKGGGGTIGK